MRRSSTKTKSLLREPLHEHDCIARAGPYHFLNVWGAFSREQWSLRLSSPFCPSLGSVFTWDTFNSPAMFTP
jgi:hypothetical protein